MEVQTRNQREHYPIGTHKILQEEEPEITSRSLIRELRELSMVTYETESRLNAMLWRRAFGIGSTINLKKDPEKQRDITHINEVLGRTRGMSEEGLRASLIKIDMERLILQLESKGQ